MTTINLSIKPYWMPLVLVLIAIALYANTVFNDYCLDDVMMITQNSITQKGFAGINDHINNDFLFGFRNSESHDAASSRWRPLSLITFSMEVGFWGMNHPHRSHVVNIILFAVIALLLFVFLNKYLLKNNWQSFFITLLFVIHPVHTEVVANIKGRDELLCMLLILSSLCLFWKYVEQENIGAMFGAMLLFFLSLTAKENGITLLAGVPIMLYFFSKQSINKILLLLIPFVITLGVYLFIRNAIVPLSLAEQSDEIMNNPFLGMTFPEKLATKIFIVLFNLKLLVFPYPLSYDYSFHQIPTHTFADIGTMIALITLIALGFVAIVGIKSKNILSACIILFFITFSISTNLVIEIGMTMGERLLFFPSLFFCMACVLAAQKLFEFIANKTSVKPNWLIGISLLPVFVLCVGEVYSRNQDWKNNNSLNMADVVKVPNSARVNNGTGSAYVTMSAEKKWSKSQHDSLIAKAIYYYNRAAQIHPTYDDAYLNLGVAYSRIDSLLQAEKYWNQVRAHAAHPKLIEYDKLLSICYYRIGMACGSRQHLDSAINYLNKSTNYLHQTDSIYLECWYNVGGANFTAKNYKTAAAAFEKVLKVNPNYRDAKNGYGAAINFCYKKE